MSGIPLNVLKNSDFLAFLAMLALAMAVSWVPILHTPFSWMETFFHEISHGLAALLTGGDVRAMRLELNGSGLCTVRGGVLFIIAFAGYAGAALWGGLIYLIADHVSARSADRIAFAIAGLIAMTAIFWARDPVTWLILAAIAVPFVVILITKTLPGEREVIQFCGLYVLINAIRAPLHLIDGSDRGDGATLQQLTWVPEIVWVLIWMALGLATLVLLFRRHLKVAAVGPD